MSTAIEMILRATNKASGPIEQVEKSLKGLEGQTDKSTGAMSRMAGMVGGAVKVSLLAGTAAVAGLTAVIGKGIKDAAGLEQGVADIASVMGTSLKDMGPFKDLIMDLGLDPELKVNAFQAADAIEMLAKNGLNMTDILNGATRSTVLLANATNDNFATAADVATDAMKMFNISAGDMSHAVDGIIGTTQQSKFDIDDYRLAIGMAGGVAGQVGVSFEDFNAVIAATSSSFTGGSDSGTSYKVFLQRLAADTAPAMEALRELGIVTDESGNRFFDASGNMKSQAEIAEILAVATRGLSDQTKIQTMSTIFGTDAQRMAMAMAKAGSTEILRQKSIIGNTSAEVAAATRMDTLSGAYEIFRGILETVSIGIGDKFLPLARRLVEWASEMASLYGPKVIEWAGKLADKMGVVVDWVLAWIDTGTTLNEKLAALPEPMQDIVQAGIWLVNTAQSIAKWIGDVVGRFVTWQDVLIAVGYVVAHTVIPIIWGLIAAATPVIATFAAIVAAVAALRLAWTNDFLGIKTATLGAIDYLKTTFSGLFKAIQQFGKGALGEIKAWLSGQQTDFHNVGKIWEKAKEAFGRLFTDMGENLKRFTDFVWSEFKDRFPQTARFFSESVQGIQKLWNEAWGQIRNFLDSVLGVISGVMERYWINWKGDWKSTLDYFLTGDVTYKLLNLFRYDIPSAIHWFIEDARLMFGQWKAKMAHQWNEIKIEAAQKWNMVQTEVMHIINTWLLDMKTRFDTWWGVTKSDWNMAWEWIKKYWNDGVAWTKTKYEEWIGQWIPDDWEKKGKALFQGLWNGLKAIWDNGQGGGIWGWTKARWQDLKDGFSRAFEEQSPSRWFMRGGENIMEGLQIGLESGTGGVFQTFDTFSNSLKARASALNVSLEGSVIQIAARITSLQNHMAALARIPQLGQNQVDNYVPTTPAPNPSPNGNVNADQAFYQRHFGTISPEHIAQINRVFADLENFGAELAMGVQEFIGKVGVSRAGNLADAQTQNALYDLGQKNVSMELLPRAIYDLIEELKQVAAIKGATNTFNLNAAPGETGSLYNQAGQLYNYLSALYGAS